MYLLEHPGSLQEYGFSSWCVLVCLKRSLELEYLLLQPSTGQTYGFSPEDEAKKTGSINEEYQILRRVNTMNMMIIKDEEQKGWKM